jgi:hypothetical protein
VCLHIDPGGAEGYCETAEEVPDEVFDSGIVVLEVDMSGLEEYLDYDPNIQDSYHHRGIDAHHFVYEGVIPPERLRIHSEQRTNPDRIYQSSILAWHILTDHSVHNKLKSFQTILDDNALTASHFRDNPALEALDYAVGDDAFVFLSVKPYNTSSVYMLTPVEIELGAKLSGDTYGFAFDAASLIGRGAIVRPRDLLADYEEIYTDCFIDEWEADEDEFLARVEELQDEVEMRGMGALDYLEDAVDRCRLEPESALTPSSCQEVSDAELLVYDKLSLDDCLYVVARGKIMKWVPETKRHLTRMHAGLT